MKRIPFAPLQTQRLGYRLGLAAVFFLLGISPTAAQEPLIKLRVGLGDVSLNKLPFIAAYEAGIYKKNGLDVEQFITQSAADVARRTGIVVPKELIRAGGRDAPIVIGGGSPLIVRWTSDAQAEDRVIIACTDPVVRWRIIARPEITNIEQLKGKRLGYSGYGAVTHFVALSFAKIMGWNPDRDLSLMSGANTMDALKSGRVDALIASELHETIATSAGYKILVELAKYNIPNAGSGVNVSRGWLKDNQEAARRFLKATVEMIALVKRNKEAAFTAMGKWYGVNDPEKQQYFYREVSNLPRKPYPSVEGIKKVMEIYNYHEMRRYKPEDFYDDSFMRQVDQGRFIESLYE
ncbi:MAG TPA: ABC transporter substrate-binding protein [Candidatus Binatia bacterium]|jgi:ABC-type nitrate/sulfonate/bicarbonate transport system substrate-binding protein